LAICAKQSQQRIHTRSECFMLSTIKRFAQFVVDIEIIEVKVTGVVNN